MKHSIVVLEGLETNPGDISWSPLEQLGDLQVYNETAQSELISRVTDAQIIVTNKLKLDKSVFDQTPKLRLICQLATGMDNIDIESAKNFGIQVKNAKNYSTEAVAQHTFSLILEMTNHVSIHDMDVHNYGWSTNGHWSYRLKPSYELAGKTLGIYGYGEIGKKVEHIAIAFGMKVIICSDHAKKGDYEGKTLVNLDTLFEQSDIISLHKPLTMSNQGIIDKTLIKRMKTTSLLINTARGGLINELDLRDALLKNIIGGAALDVLSTEPPVKDHPLIGISNCIITPHIAWTPLETRKRLIDITAQNIQDYLTQSKVNKPY